MRKRAPACSLPNQKTTPRIKSVPPCSRKSAVPRGIFGSSASGAQPTDRAENAPTISETQLCQTQKDFSTRLNARIARLGSPEETLRVGAACGEGASGVVLCLRCWRMGMAPLWDERSKPRAGSKNAQVVAMLQDRAGTTIAAIMELQRSAQLRHRFFTPAKAKSPMKTAPTTSEDKFSYAGRAEICHRYGADRRRRNSALLASYLAAARLPCEPSMTVVPSDVDTHHLHFRPRLFTTTSKTGNRQSIAQAS